MIQVCKQKFKDPIMCMNFDHDDEICNCVIQLQKLRAGFVLVETTLKIRWLKRQNAVRLGYGSKINPFELGVNIDGTGLPEPDWVHMHGNCLSEEIEN